MMAKTYRYCRIDRRGCIHCGCPHFEQAAVIDDSLAAGWELSGRERRWLDQREGHRCRGCAMSKRVRMLLWTIRRRCRPGSELRILHLNQTNALGPALEGLGSVTETLYRPDQPLGSRIGGCFNEDMSRLSFEDNRFDLAVHSETLEHLPDYRRALDEVRRVLKPGGIQVYTVPLLFSRATRQRMTLDESGRLVSQLPPQLSRLQPRISGHLGVRGRFLPAEGRPHPGNSLRQLLEKSDRLCPDRRQGSLTRTS